jgi:hypothetical protein
MAASCGCHELVLLLLKQGAQVDPEVRYCAEIYVDQLRKDPKLFAGSDSRGFAFGSRSRIRWLKFISIQTEIINIQKYTYFGH